MNELKQYAQDRMKEFTSLRKPSSYDESFYGKIKDAKDLEEQFRYTEDPGACQCALKGASHSGLETSPRQAVSRSTGSEFCVAYGNICCEA